MVASSRMNAQLDSLKDAKMSMPLAMETIVNRYRKHNSLDHNSIQ